MDNWELLLKASGRFAGFSLEKRQEWPQKWRVRILPNKQERQDYRIEAYGNTPEEALQLALKALGSVDRNRTP